MEGRQNRPCGFIVGRSSFRMPNAGHLALNGSAPWGPERDLQLCGAPGLRPLRIGEDVRTGTGGPPGMRPLRYRNGFLASRRTELTSATSRPAGLCLTSLLYLPMQRSPADPLQPVPRRRHTDLYLCISADLVCLPHPMQPYRS